MKGRKITVGAGLVFALGLLTVALATLVMPTATNAAPGDNLRTIIADRTGTDCASFNAEGDHESVGVGIAFDGTDLLISCYSDNSITAINPADGSQVALHFISGADSLGALAWDGNTNQLWGCSDFGTVGIVDLTLDTFTPVFDTFAVAFPIGSSSGCFDGLAYDGTDITIWASGDVSSTVEHYTTAGAPISKDSISGLIGGCGNSGIAVGGANLYLANNGCSEIHELPKDFSSSALFSSFPRRLEDLECDDLNFAGAIWSIDAYDNILNAWEIPPGLCGFGGLPAGEAKGRMTGGGSVFTEENVRVTHGFTLHCKFDELPNRLEVNWEGHSFHMESLDSARCTDDPDIEPQPPAADFDTHQGTGSGRYDGVSGARAEWTFTDAGQPGRNDTATIRIYDAGDVLVLEVSNNLNKGNQQAHQGQPGEKATDTPPPGGCVLPGLAGIGPTPTATPGPTTTPTDTPDAPPEECTPTNTPVATGTPVITPTDTPMATGTLVITPTDTPMVTPTATPPTPVDKPEMALSVKGGGSCDDPVQPTKCTVPLGGLFILSVDVLTAPAQGYAGLQTFIDYGLSLSYKETLDPGEEMVWPDAVIAFRSGGPGFVGHGGLTSLLPPLPLSFFEGNAVELLMNCTPGASSTEVKLLPEGDPLAGTSGTLFIDNEGVIIASNVGSLTINCTDVPALADTDGDGCTDLQELGPDAQSGGQRDPNNPWDFYDTDGNGIVDLPNDILGVIVAFGAYDVIYDRGPSVGPHPWNMTAPDGVIDLPNDILGVIQQFGHDCQ